MFYKTVKDSVLFNTDGHLQFYIPERYFTTKCSIVNGEYILTLGMFNYSLHDDKGKMIGGIKLFDFPSSFLTKPRSIEKVRNYSISENSNKEDYRILKYEKNDVIIVHTKVPQDVENVETIFRLFVISGNPPSTIPYYDTYKPFIESMEINGGSYGTSNQLFGIMVSELYRDPNDKSKPYRLSKAKKDKKWEDYQSISVKDVSNYVSPFVSITSESFDDSLIQATMMDPNDSKYSPLEKIFTGR